MFGFTEEELIALMDSQNITKEEQETLISIMKENYDGYRFAMNVERKMYNSNMCLYLLSDYVRLGRPELKIPNLVMRELYAEYFLESIQIKNE